jgi:hypothetical protein
MKFRPETDNDRTEGIPSAPAGEHVMRISSWIEDRQTKNGTKDLVEFVGEIPYDGEIVMVGSTMWISHPENGKKGNLWKYRQLAEALGEDAVAEYRSKDADGFSKFNPMNWKDRAVLVEVGQYGIEEVRRLDKQPSRTPTSRQRTEDNWDKTDDEISAEIAAARIAKKANATNVRAVADVHRSPKIRAGSKTPKDRPGFKKRPRKKG